MKCVASTTTGCEGTETQKLRQSLMARVPGTFITPGIVAVVSAWSIV